MARAVVHNLIRKGVKLLALDFDLTIVGIHTGGAWRGPVAKLAQHVRPCFRALIEAGLEFSDIHICVVTYSLQQDLIKDLLKCVLPNSDTGRILIRTSCKDWLPKNGPPSAPSLGKQQHIARVTTDLYNLRRAIVHPHEVLLMDDDEENVSIAKHFGHLAFLVKETVMLEDIAAFVERIQEYEDPSSHFPCSALQPEPSASFAYDARCGSSATGLRAAAGGGGTPQRQAYSMLENQRTVHVQDTSVPQMSAQSSATFSIPRPAVVNGQNTMSVYSDVNARRLEPVSVQLGSPSLARAGYKPVYVVKTNENVISVLECGSSYDAGSTLNVVLYMHKKSPPNQRKPEATEWTVLQSFCNLAEVLTTADRTISQETEPQCTADKGASIKHVSDLI